MGLNSSRLIRDKGLLMITITLIIILINKFIIESFSLTWFSITVDYTYVVKLITVLLITPIIFSLIIALISRSILLSIAYFLIQILVFVKIVQENTSMFLLTGLFYLLLLVLMAPFITILLKLKKSFIETDSLVFFIKNTRFSMVFDVDSISQLALHFTIASIILFIVSIIGLVTDETFFTTGVLLVLPLTTLLIVKTKKPVLAFHASIIASSSWYGLPAIPLLVANILREHDLYSSELNREGIVLGYKESVLTYDKPKHVYSGVRQDPVIEKAKHTRKKTWYWQTCSGTLTLNLSNMPNMHISIFGASGMGKSLLAKSIILQAYKKYGYSFLVLDHHNEYLDIIEVLGSKVNILDTYKASINPFELDPNTSPKQRAIEIADIIKSIFNLGYIQRDALEEVFIRTYELKGIFNDDPSTWIKPPPNFVDVLDVIDNYSQDSVYGEQYKRIRPYIKMLTQDVFIETKISFQEVLEKPTVILLATLPSDQVRAMYIDTFLNRLIGAMYTTRIKNNILLVIDEAHLLFKRSRSRALVNRLFMESRKYGLGIIAITQQPLDTSEAVILNSSTKIVFGLTEFRNLDYIAKTLSGYSDFSKIYAVKLAISSLKKFQALACMDNTLYIIDTSHSLNTFKRST